MIVTIARVPDQPINAQQRDRSCRKATARVAAGGLPRPLRPSRNSAASTGAVISRHTATNTSMKIPPYCPAR
jgi:hypothetical protein